MAEFFAAEAGLPFATGFAGAADFVVALDFAAGCCGLAALGLAVAFGLAADLAFEVVLGVEAPEASALAGVFFTAVLAAALPVALADPTAALLAEGLPLADLAVAADADFADAGAAAVATFFCAPLLADGFAVVGFAVLVAVCFGCVAVFASPVFAAAFVLAGLAGDLATYSSLAVAETDG